MIEEKISVTAVGALSLVLLILTGIGTLFAYSAAKTVFQEIEAGVAFLGSAIVFGLGVALGRRRTYRIYRSKNRDPY